MFEKENVSRIAPFAVYILFIILEDVLLELGCDAHELRWLYIVKIAIVAALLWHFRRTYRELYWPAENTSCKTWAIAIFSGLMVFIAWINLTADWMIVGGPKSFDPHENGQINWTLTIGRLIGATLVVPLMEEIFWRSFLMRWIQRSDFLTIKPSQIGVKAFCTTAILFAIAHNFWFAGLFAGIVYNLLYVRSENLWSPMIAHAVTNGLLGIWVITTNNWSFW